MLIQKLEACLYWHGLTPERARAAAEVIAPLLQNYLDEAATCGHLPAWIRQTKRQQAQLARARRNPYPEIDAAIAAGVVPDVTEVLDVHCDSVVHWCLVALRIKPPKRVLLAGDDEHRYGVHFNHLASEHLVSPGGLRLYLYDQRGGDMGTKWLANFLATYTGKRVCDRCYARWVDQLAEDHIRFLAIEDYERAAMMEPYLRYIAPYAYFERFTADGDLICRCR